ncbi:hypothetical protein RvY_02388 [Ramazzottius varieornatus]|uniref:Uncharacterized protein n=1 Tax=Ramazzottius varieornatus TaxID=947166 RepID=A0A1D1UMW5_RAMVA|nr:hypothetical protein RvY_02388 [Ramazzottius varieornatus]
MQIGLPSVFFHSKATVFQKMGSSILIFLALAGIYTSVTDAAELRNRRQTFGFDEVDLVNGALLADCVFYGDNTVDCNGRLTCKPSDLEDRPTITMLDRTCPKTQGQKSGTWTRDQVIPTNMLSGNGVGREAKCQFYANRGTGHFKCTNTRGDSWKGDYTGSINTAFKLGLPMSSTYGRGTGLTGDDGYGTGYGAGYGTTRSRYYGGNDYETAGSRYGDNYGNTDRNNYDGNRYSTSIGLNDRDRDYDRLNSATYPNRDRYSTSSRDDYNRDRDSQYGTGGETTSQVTMCTYKNTGKGTCRDCTEKVNRKVTDREIRTTKHYTCSGPESRTSWSEDNGVAQAGMRPQPLAATERIAFTCVFRPDEVSSRGGKFECHGASTDGNCGLTNDGYGSSGSTNLYDRDRDSTTTQRCLSGEKWSGTYRGIIY